MTESQVIAEFRLWVDGEHTFRPSRMQLREYGHALFRELDRVDRERDGHRVISEVRLDALRRARAASARAAADAKRAQIALAEEQTRTSLLEQRLRELDVGEVLGEVRRDDGSVIRLTVHGGGS